MVEVPERFRPHINVDYPEGNSPIFEEWFYTKCDHENYLPVFWTSYFVNNGYGKNIRAKKDLQQFVDSLDKSKQYFTIVQYDDGPLVRLPPNVKVFAMSGPRIDYPLPLICQPHKYQFKEERDIFCNFIGRLTHPIRRELMNVLQGKSGYLTCSNIIPTEDFCRILSKSVFTLCPRGYGQTSFRICEALQYGSIPVYISDQFIMPHRIDFQEYGVLVDAKHISEVSDILSGYTPEMIERLQDNGRKIYSEKYSFQGCKDLILQNI
jgi:glycosyltransferase involved in cell wall biosynthesis